MTESRSVRRELADPYGEWAGTRGVLMSYRYLASRPKAIDRDHAQGWIALRPDLRHPGGALAAPLAIAMLDVAGINVDPINILALTQIDVEVLDPSSDVEEVHLVGHVTCETRSQIFTEVRMHDAADPQRAIGFGTANWSVIVPTPEGFTYPEPGTGIEGLDVVPALYEAYTGRRRDDGRLEIPSLAPEIGTDRLHHGPMLVVCEAAALQAAAEHVGTDTLTVEHLGLTIVRPGRVGPFVADPVFIGAAGRSVAVRVELRDEGNGGRLFAAMLLRMRVVDRCTT
ncbi:hotdog domain-containing protein [Frankia sp. Cr2]|uniref:hotdog domain-containing protein n=1 Tax=Frankia sp. Cr2 TaxID=3073932 RepID=UPI002AD55BF2|nr:hotdog domain-containing protein [Frankia sp. Cr2]